MTVGTDDFNRTTQAINKQTEAMKNQNKQFGINQKNQRNPRGNSAALKSGLVSGAFPLLFGQGPLGGVAGFAGGFLGTKMGGQMGGFCRRSCCYCCSSTIDYSCFKYGKTWQGF